jgi:hypothetical protein
MKQSNHFITLIFDNFDNDESFQQAVKTIEDLICKNKTILTTEDGVALKVGDRFLWVNNKQQSGWCEVSSPSFKLFPELKAFSSAEALNKYWYDTQIMFTTEDDVQMKRGDTPWYVNEKDWKLVHWKEGIKYYNEHKHIHYFNFKSNAEAFIDQNKPQFSKKDIVNAVNRLPIGFRTNIGTYTTEEFISKDKRIQSLL